jgi:hypothetical protein
MVLLVALGGTLLFACGGSDDDGDDNGSEPTADATMDDGANPTDDGAEPTDDGSDSGNGDTNSELRELAGKMADQEAHVAYTFSSTGGGTDSTGTFTLFWRPPDQWRLDIDMDGTTVTSISKEGTTYFCSDDGSGGGSCFASPTGLPLPFLSYFTDPDALTDLVDTEISGVDFDKSSDSIAGQDVTCYSAEGTVEGQSGSGEYCFNDDGLLMRVSGESAGSTFELEASTVEGAVSDADFELPYDVIDIPGQ